MARLGNCQANYPGWHGLGTIASRRGGRKARHGARGARIRRRRAERRARQGHHGRGRGRAVPGRVWRLPRGRGRPDGRGAR